MKNVEFSRRTFIKATGAFLIGGIAGSFDHERSLANADALQDNANSELLDMLIRSTLESSSEGTALSLDEVYEMTSFITQRKEELPISSFILNDESLADWSAELDTAFQNSDILPAGMYEQYAPYSTKLVNFSTDEFLKNIPKAQVASGVTFCVNEKNLKNFSDFDPERNNTIEINSAFLDNPFSKIKDGVLNSEWIIREAMKKEDSPWWLWTLAHEKAHQLARICGGNNMNNFAEMDKLETTANIIALEVLAKMMRENNREAIYGFLYGLNQITFRTLLFHLMTKGDIQQLPHIVASITNSSSENARAQLRIKGLVESSSAASTYRNTDYKYGAEGFLYIAGSANEDSNNAYPGMLGGIYVFDYEPSEGGGKLKRGRIPYKNFYTVANDLGRYVKIAGGDPQPRRILPQLEFSDIANQNVPTISSFHRNPSTRNSGLIE